jgi:hypothetical protein
MLACFDYLWTTGCSASACDVARDTTNTAGVPMSTLPADNDCANLGTIGSATTSSFGPGAATPSNNNFNFGFSASAEILGAAGFSFLVTSNGISGAATIGPSPILADTTLASITFSVSGVPISVTPTIGLVVNGQADGAITGSMAFGASAALTVDIGGGVKVPSVWDATGNLIVPTASNFQMYKDINFVYGTVPFRLTSVTAAANLNLNIAPKVKLAIYNAIPITATPVMAITASLKMGGSRMLSDHEPAYGLRRLATCPATAVSFSATTSGTLGVGVGTVTTQALVSGINTAVLNSAIPSGALALLGTGTAVPAQSIVAAGTVVQAPTTLAADQCTAAGGTGSATTTPPSNAATSSGGGSSSSGGSCGTGCIIGAVVGSLAGVALIGGVMRSVLVTAKGGASTKVGASNVVIRSVEAGAA